MSLSPGHFADLPPTQIRRYLARAHAHNLASLQYHALPLPILVHLFIAQEEAGLFPMMGWNTLVPEGLLRVIRVAGNHKSMMQSPNIQGFGQILSTEILTQAEGLSDDSRECPVLLSSRSTDAI